jgi:HEAT repeat protein
MGMGAVSEVTVIMERVNDNDQLVCCKALMILGDIGSEAKAAVPAILRALRDEDGLIRINACNALRKIDPEAVAEVRMR